MQVRVYRWEHRDREDVLTEANDAVAPLVTPPLFRLAPGGGSQIIRIGFQKESAAPGDERQWRVIVEEIPNLAPQVGADPGMQPPPTPLSIAVHVRVSLPLLQRPQNAHQDLQWRLERSTPGRVILTAQNLGSVTERLDAVHLGPSEEANASISGPVYVFPGESRRFELGPEIVLPAGNVHLSVQGTPRPLMRELVLSAQ